MSKNTARTTLMAVSLAFVVLGASGCVALSYGGDGSKIDWREIKELEERIEELEDRAEDLDERFEELEEKAGLEEEDEEDD